MKTDKEKVEVMQHFTAGGKVEMQCTDGSWKLNAAPQWNWGTTDYLIAEEADPYAELKKADKDSTKQIRSLDIRGRGDHGPWQDAGYGWKWVFPPEEYEIRDKPKPMKKVKLLAWFDEMEGDLIWRKEGYPMSNMIWKQRVPSEDKELEVGE